MNLDGLSLFQLMGQKLGWLSARQSLLSRNVANADTPGYLPMDLKPFNFKESLQGVAALPMRTTNPMHLVGGMGASMTPETVRAEVQEMRPDGNGVSIEDELTKVADTGMDYQMVTNLYRKQVGLIKTAIGRGTAA